MYSTLEVYGFPAIRPIDIPEWHLTVGRPAGDGQPARRGAAGYSMFGKDIPDSDIRYNREQDAVDIRVGGLTERTTAPWTSGSTDETITGSRARWCIFVAMGRADPRLCSDNRKEGCMPIIHYF